MKTKLLFLIVLFSLKIAFALPSIVNQALSLDGSGACVDVPNSVSLNLGSNFTVEALVNFQVGGSQNPRILSKGWQASGGYELLTSGTTDKRNIVFYVGQTVTTSVSVLSAGSWNYVAVTYDGNMFRMYINGILDSINQSPGILLTNPFDINIGRNAGNFTDHYQGLIDEVHLWNRTLSEVEIQANMNQKLTGNETNLVACWNFDNGTANDLSVYHNDGSFIGTATTVVTAFPPNLGNIIITQQPTNQIAPSGSSVIFTVNAIGSSPLNYQWLFNGQTMPTATNATLTVTANALTTLDGGGYSVVVWNAYGTNTSATASLKLLGIDTSVACYLMTVTPLPDRQSGKNNLVVVTHGLEPGENNALANLLVGDDVSWITNMCIDISNQLAIRGSNDWQVVPYAWVSQAGLPPWYSFTGNNIEGDIGSLQFAKLAEPALENAENIGTQIGRQIAAQGWSHVHLIAHSAGAGLIQKAAEAIRANSPSTVIQTTFLDPFLGTDYRGVQRYGTDANWSDDYFTYDQLTGSYSQGVLLHAFNVDVTWVDPSVSVTPVYVPGNEGGFNQFSPHIIGYTALSSHEWPHDFYQETISGTVTNCADGFGFPLSMEVGGGNNLLIYPEGSSPQEPCGTTPISQNPFTVNTGSQLPIGVLPNSMSSFGVTLSGNSGINLSSSVQVSPQAKIKFNGQPQDNASTNSTGTTAWFAVGLMITNFVNFIQFDAAFTDSNSAEGLLTVYWDTNQIGTVDERVVSLGLQTYKFFLPNAVTNNVYVLGFRLDSFDNTSSSITVTNVATGFAGITTPLTLGLTLTNSTPILQLTGASNYNYLVQTSTNLVDWTPTALLVNSNGTVLFPDSTATNSGTRFYRALMP